MKETASCNKQSSFLEQLPSWGECAFHLRHTWIRHPNRSYPTEKNQDIKITQAHDFKEKNLEFGHKISEKNSSIEN